MESLIKQTRSRFSGARQDNKDERNITTDRKLTQPQKTQPFKDRKRSQSWIRRQFSRQMSSDYDLSGADYPAAIAAAAFAVQSLEESKTKEKKETNRGPSDKSSDKMKSRVEDTTGLNEPLKSALKSSDETSRKSFTGPDIKNPTSKMIPEKEPSFKRRISFADTDETIRKELEKPALEEKASQVRPPSMKKPPPFADKQLSEREISMPKPNTIRPMTQPVEPRYPSATRAGARDSQAEAWEKEEMVSIKERYESLRATIDNWETKKKRNAKRKIERTQAELDKRRAKAMQSHRHEITRIEGIAGGARKQAEMNRIKEELKVKDKANKIRLTGKIPATCMCF